MKPNTAVDCANSVEYFRGALEGYLSSQEADELELHLSGCSECSEAAEQYSMMHGMMDNLLGSRRISPDFDERSTRRLMERREAMKTGSITSQDLTAQAIAGFQKREFTYEGEDDDEQAVAQPSEGFLDSLQERFGAAPWWIISGAFHTLLILLITLIGLAIMRVKDKDTVIVTDLAKEKEPEEIKEQRERDVIERPEVPVVEEVNDQTPIVTHEEVEISDHVETADDSDFNETKGEDGISDVYLGGSGTVAALGLGGGGGGAFGRPGGRGGRLRRAIRGGGGRATESAVDRALEWLARHQSPDGSWKVQELEGSKPWDIGVTGLATLAFLGAGHTEKIGKYRTNVQKAVAWMISKQQANGSIGPGQGYHHPIAGMALAEAGAMARTSKTIQAAQRAVNYTCEIHQYGTGSNKFGWRYKAKDKKGDLSNVGWFVLQLKSAKVAGLGVNPASFEGAIKYLDHVMADPVNVKKVDDTYDNGGHRYGYSDKKPWINTTAIGVLCRLFTGTKPEQVRGAAMWLLKTEPPRWSAKLGRGVGNHPFPMYYLYYNTLTMFQVGGDIWKQWNVGMKSVLCKNQRRGGDEDGSWDPLSKHEKMAGRAYTTAMGALSLEVYYRYLPMYRE